MVEWRAKQGLTVFRFDFSTTVMLSCLGALPAGAASAAAGDAGLAGAEVAGAAGAGPAAAHPAQVKSQKSEEHWHWSQVVPLPLPPHPCADCHKSHPSLSVQGPHALAAANLAPP